MGINMANTALATETLGGKSQPPHYDYKARATRYIKSKPELLAKTTFVWCAFYASNFAWDFLKPVYFPAIGQYVQMQATPSDQPIACIGNTRSNFGAFVGAALTQPETTRVGQTVFAFVERSTLGGLLKIWTEVHGVKATYVQIPRDTFFATWSAKAQEFTLGMEFWELVKDQEWTGEDRFLTYADLGLDITTLKSVKDSFAELEL
ncbi:uncharacterized protein TrAFT101_006225 [Trichoderma asperellum]|uniref:uncharacterized protein n=1 Tax=Trichoderma asperellum TaxID=101201 RepID=UPI003318AECA|nr:hypothetical protein TrAFT101_006225 [Trichoderma asperellum]